MENKREKFYALIGVGGFCSAFEYFHIGTTMQAGIVAGHYLAFATIFLVIMGVIILMGDSL